MLHCPTLHYMSRQISVRIEDGLYDSVLQFAQGEGRTFSNAVEVLLRFGLEGRNDIPQTKGQSKTEGKPTEISHPRRQRVKGADTVLVSGRQLGAGETGIQVAEGSLEGSARRTESTGLRGVDDGRHAGIVDPLSQFLGRLPDMKCLYCQGLVSADPKQPTKYWKCGPCKRQLEEYEVRAWI